MEAFASVINVLLEKRLVPTVVGFVTASIVYYFTPDNSVPLKKLGVFWYVLLLTAIIFLLISFIQYLIRDKKYGYYFLNKKKLLKSLWETIDNYTPQEKMFLLSFLESGNQEITVTDEDIEDFYEIDIEEPKMFQRTHSVNENGEECYLCNLQPLPYKLLKHSMDKYGRICHFKEDYIFNDSVEKTVQ